MLSWHAVKDRAVIIKIDIKQLFNIGVIVFCVYFNAKLVIFSHNYNKKNKKSSFLLAYYEKRIYLCRK